MFNYPISRVEDDGSTRGEPTENDYVIGVRPERIHVVESGGIEGEIYSAMPTGMETTVRIRVGNFLLTGVVFGEITYAIGEKVHIEFAEDGIMLFSRISGKLIGTGTVEL